MRHVNLKIIVATEKSIMIKYIFPTIMISLNLGQAIITLCRKDYMTALYWFAAAVLNFSVAAKK